MPSALKETPGHSDGVLETLREAVDSGKETKAADVHVVKAPESVHQKVAGTVECNLDRRTGQSG